MEYKEIKIMPDGTAVGFEDEIKEVIKEYKLIERRRVSKIVPENIFLRILFTIIRKAVKDNSRIAHWTRRWKCSWIVIIKNKKYGPFNDRKRAIEFEKTILRKKINF